jgi:hypothetical protein
VVSPGHAKAAAHFRQAPGALLGSQLLHPSRDRGLVLSVGEELAEELLAGVGGETRCCSSAALVLQVVLVAFLS